MAHITEGTMDFHGLKTYYRICGSCENGKSPLLLLHGGPGSTHNSLEVLDPIADTGRAVITYDQIGCGLSPAPGRTDLFNRETWVEELVALRKHLGLDRLHLFGQSWGGMLLLEYVCNYEHSGLRSLILSSTLPSSRLYGEEQHRMIREMPEEMQEAIRTAEETGDYDSPAYAAANAEFLLRHCAPKWPEDAPECLRRPRATGTEAYNTGWGPNEFTPLGNLSDWDVTGQLRSIREPALITSGIMDMCTPLIAKLMYDEIPDSEWVLFGASRHMSYAEENGKYLTVLSDWLDAHD